MVSVRVAAKANGTKLKPLLFSVQLKKSKSLDEEFKSRCEVKSSGKAWMNEELTIIWVKQVLGAFSFNKQLLARDSNEYHMTKSVKKDLKEMNVDRVTISGACRKYIQAPDVCLNKPFKARMTELYDQWFSGGVYQSWSQLSKENIIKSFKCCGLNLANDDMEDDFIHRLKKG